MIIRKIKIRNFKSHKETNATFNDGITVITGKNGAGKSTILEAIHYALFKKNGKGAIRNGTDSMSVELTFVENGETYVVKRTKNNARTLSSLHKALPNGETEKLADSNSETDKMVQDIIGIDPELFMNAVYVRQGEISDIISKSPSERKKLITKLLKIDRLEKAWALMPQVIREYEMAEALLQGEVREYGPVAVEIKENEMLVSSYENELHVELARKRKMEDQSSEIGSWLLDWKKVADERAENVRKVHMLKSDLMDKEKDFNILQRKYEKIMDMDNRIYTLKPHADHEKLRALNDEGMALGNEMVLLKHRNNELENSLKEVLESDGKCPVCMSPIKPERKMELETQYMNETVENDNRIKTITEELNRIRQEKRNIETAIHRIHELEKETANKENIKNQKDKTLTELEQLKKNIRHHENKAIETELDHDKYAMNEEKLAETNRKIQSSIEKIGMLKGSIQRTKETNRKLHEKLQNITYSKTRLEQTTLYRETLQDMRENYSKNGIQAEIRSIVKPLIQSNTKKHFERFNFEYHDMTLTDDYDITVSNINGKTNVAGLSGGEQIAAALSLRLGITETLMERNVGCIILDEPTIHLDKTRVHELSNLLRKMEMVPQSIIVTHEEALEGIADTIIKVHKENGESMIT